MASLIANSVEFDFRGSLHNSIRRSMTEMLMLCFPGTCFFFLFMAPSGILVLIFAVVIFLFVSVFKFLYELYTTSYAINSAF